MKSRFSGRALKAAASIATVSLFSLSAHAAECFDRDTDDPKAGNATAVVGPDVDVARQNVANMFRPDNGADMFTGDTVRTGDESHLQLKLCDWSTYTFSPNSESAISEFFTPDGAGRRRAVNFVRGGFRLSSGRDTDPDSTEVEIQETGVTMGVRGTNVILVELDGFIYALLEGPVLDNDGLARRGVVDFWKDGDREAVEARLKRPGYVVRISPDGTISDPFRADAALLRRIYDAFVPVFREEDASPLDYAGNPLDDSGQGSQEGKDGRDYAGYRSERDEENTENLPEQPSEEGEDRKPSEPDPVDPVPVDPVPIPVGDILPLPDLDDFAGLQAGPDGHVFAVAPAQLFTDDGTGAVLADDGVAIIQIAVDWASRTLAPEALASFVKFDFSVANPSDLSIDDFDATVPDEVEDAFVDALLASADIPFAMGDAGLAVFPTQTFTFTVRQGPGDTATADVDVDFSAPSGGVTYNLALGVADLMFMPGAGDLVFFDYPLANVSTITELEGFATSGSVLLSGASDVLAATLGAPAFLTGVSYGQVLVDFDNQTLGGGDSFLAYTAAADPAIGGAVSTQYVALNQTAPFSSGLFNLAFYPVGGLSSDANLRQGQVLVRNNGELSGDVAAIVSDGAGNNIYTEIRIDEAGLPSSALATIADLDAQAGAIEGLFSQPAGGTLRYAGLINSLTSGFADLTTANGTFLFGDMQASIDINFANRTIGGGSSFVQVDLFDGSAPALSFVEGLNAVSFNDAASGVGVFGFDSSDFSGSNIDSALFLIRDNPSGVGAGDSADLFVRINDGAGGEGSGEIRNMPLLGGATPPTIP